MRQTLRLRAMDTAVNLCEDMAGIIDSDPYGSQVAVVHGAKRSALVLVATRGTRDSLIIWMWFDYRDTGHVSVSTNAVEQFVPTDYTRLLGHLRQSLDNFNHHRPIAAL